MQTIKQLQSGNFEPARNVHNSCSVLCAPSGIIEKMNSFTETIELPKSKKFLKMNDMDIRTYFIKFMHNGRGKTPLFIFSSHLLNDMPLQKHLLRSKDELITISEDYAHYLAQPTTDQDIERYDFLVKE